jgi:YggT family protein
VDLIRVIHGVSSVLYILIIIDVIASWVPALNGSMFIAQLRRVTDPILAPFRLIIPPQLLGIDVSPIAALFAIRFLEQLLTRMLR